VDYLWLIGFVWVVIAIALAVIIFWTGCERSDSTFAVSVLHSLLDTRAAIAARMKTVKQMAVVVLSVLVVTVWLTAILYFSFIMEF
jgi:hypothetical protein